MKLIIVVLLLSTSLCSCTVWNSARFVVDMFTVPEKPPQQGTPVH